MKEFIKENFPFLIFLFIVLLLLIGGIWAASSDVKQNKEKALQQYKECKKMVLENDNDRKAESKPGIAASPSSNSVSDNRQLDPIPPVVLFKVENPSNVEKLEWCIKSFKPDL